MNEQVRLAERWLGPWQGLEGAHIIPHSFANRKATHPPTTLLPGLLIYTDT